MTRRPTAADGIVVVDKPSGWTSHDVVAKMRGLAATRKVGHAGTLDPMATGVLVLGIGRATRLLTYITGADKEYLATIRLGESTTTDDAEGEPVQVADASGVDMADIEAGIAALTGDIDQVPSSVSAIKVGGVRSYARVRAGEQVTLDSRPITIHSFELLAVSVQPPAIDLDVKVVCSSGTYIRALARDLGAALGVGGHLTALRRTRVGGFGLDLARDLNSIATSDPDQPIEVLAPGAAAGRIMAVRTVDPAEAVELGHGRTVARKSEPAETHIGALDSDGVLVAVLAVAEDRLRPVLVLETR